jgi:hypothetical protein
MKKITILLSTYLFCTHVLAMQLTEIPHKKQSTTPHITCTWPQCALAFSNSILLSAHIKAHEECEGKIHRCKSEDCKQYFYSKKHLDSHAREYHPTLALAVAKKIKKCGIRSRKLKSPKKRKSKAEGIRIAPLPQLLARLEPITVVTPVPFKAPFHPDTQVLLTCLERRRQMHEPGKKSILYKVPFKIANDEMVKTTGALVTQLIECPVKGCSEKFATTHGKLHHLIHIHKHELYTRPLES